MTNSLSLDNLRRELGRTWIIALFGIAYLVSQVTIILSTVASDIKRDGEAIGVNIYKL